MNRDDVEWRGYCVASPTPFTREGGLDLERLAAVIREFLDAGAHILCVNGSTGEWYAQSTDERMQVVEAAIKEVAGEVPIIVGTSSMHLEETVALAEHAIHSGADGVMYSTPPAGRLTQCEALEFYRRTASAIPGPVMVYNIPPDVGTNIKPETLLRLAEIPNVVAVKDSTPDDLQFHRTIGTVGDELRVFGNVLTPAGLSMAATGYGGDGHFGSGMPLGRRTAQAFELLWAGNHTEALAIAEEFVYVRAALHAPDGNGVFGGMQAQVKAAMRLQGCDAGYPRPPRIPIEDDPAAMDGLKALLERLGLLSGRELVN